MGNRDAKRPRILEEERSPLILSFSPLGREASEQGGGELEPAPGGARSAPSSAKRPLLPAPGVASPFPFCRLSPSGKRKESKRGMGEKRQTMLLKEFYSIFPFLFKVPCLESSLIQEFEFSFLNKNRFLFRKKFLQRKSEFFTYSNSKILNSQPLIKNTGLSFFEGEIISIIQSKGIENLFLSGSKATGGFATGTGSSEVFGQLKNSNYNLSGTENSALILTPADQISFFIPAFLSFPSPFPEGDGKQATRGALLAPFCLALQSKSKGPMELPNFLTDIEKQYFINDIVIKFNKMLFFSAAPISLRKRPLSRRGWEASYPFGEGKAKRPFPLLPIPCPLRRGLAPLRKRPLWG